MKNNGPVREPKLEYFLFLYDDTTKSTGHFEADRRIAGYVRRCGGMYAIQRKYEINQSKSLANTENDNNLKDDQFEKR